MVVAPDGSGDFRTVQEAVNAVRDLAQQPVTIFIRRGVYREKLLVPAHKTNVRLVGEDRDQTILTWADHTGDAAGHNTYSSYSLKVEGNDFGAENLTIENAAGPVGQAVALHVTGDRAAFRHCRIRGHQDTLFAAAENSRQYYQNCLIEGTTDFLFGSATAVFDHCTLHSLKDSYVTAASTTPRQRYGFVFLDCRFTAAPAAHKVYLGRPWRPYARTVLVRCELGAHIRPEGWHNWGKPANEQTAYYAEYQSTGPGAPAGQRVAWSRQLTRRQARPYTVARIFGGQQDAWVPAAPPPAAGR
ncbi:pectin esterase [Hymenobacter edaphi]|uniref:Pectin esterase n=1 Tax=Hymenobacter edaphi TaxID=2211146 RepID=A0A328BF60_9BACT|nr:pectin esterase [Hymenobacter edaphi]